MIWFKLLSEAKVGSEDSFYSVAYSQQWLSKECEGFQISHTW